MKHFSKGPSLKMTFLRGEEYNQKRLFKEVERNNRTPTIIFSYFKLHPTLDTNLDLNAELLLLFSFTYDSFLAIFPREAVCKCDLLGCSTRSNMYATLRKSTRLCVAAVVTKMLDLTARFK